MEDYDDYNDYQDEQDDCSGECLNCGAPHGTDHHCD